jgi:protein TonB
MNRYYPDRASRMEVEGRASLSCTVNARGTLEGCSVTSEDPADMGFGDAALKMSKLFKMRPMSKDGQPVDGGTVRIPLRFVLPKG